MGCFVCDHCGKQVERVHHIMDIKENAYDDKRHLLYEFFLCDECFNEFIEWIHRPAMDAMRKYKENQNGE